MPESPPRNPIAAVVAGALGMVLAATLPMTSWSDVPAPWTWVAAASGIVVVAAAFRPPPLAVFAYWTLAFATALWTSAGGSTFAALTWVPIIMAAVAVGQLSPVFLLAYTATALLRDVPTLVVLSQTFGVAGTSGSHQYYLGLVGVIAASMWFPVASHRARGFADYLARIAAIAVTGLGAWAAMASGSRAALLGLAVAVLATFVGRFLVPVGQRSPWRSTLLASLFVIVSVPLFDVVLGSVFGDGGSTLMPTVVGSVDSTVAQAVTEGSSLGGVRLALWQQALTAVQAQPLGHGFGSYGYVNHAYQNAPMLWSGSPHSVWALVAVETGWPGLILLLIAVIGALLVAARRGDSAMPALLGATAVMSLDLFASMPAQSLVWWAAIGTAWYRSGSIGIGRLRWVAVGAVVVLAGAGLLMGARFALPCDAGCDRVARFAGHPRFIGQLSVVAGEDPDGPRWHALRDRYPLAFWLRAREARVREATEPMALLVLLRAFPFESAQTYVDVSTSLGRSSMAADVAACGLVRFFDGRTIYRDWRSSAAELREQQDRLRVLAVGVAPVEAACERAGIPPVALGLQ